MEKTYLGDGVYANIENGMIKLTTEDQHLWDDGISITNVIYLEPEVLTCFLNYIAQLSKERG